MSDLPEVDRRITDLEINDRIRTSSLSTIIDRLSKLESAGNQQPPQKSGGAAFCESYDASESLTEMQLGLSRENSQLRGANSRLEQEVAALRERVAQLELTIKVDARTRELQAKCIDRTRSILHTKSDEPIEDSARRVMGDLIDATGTTDLEELPVHERCDLATEIYDMCAEMGFGGNQ